MAAANPISSSCQSIASISNSVSLGAVGGSGSLRGSNNSHHTHSQHQQTQYVNGTGSLGRLKYHHKQKSLDASDDEELDYSQLSQSTHILGRVKSDRFLASKLDEDRRRRTIIVEKKNDSFGFTLQSYGIHYKRDEEVEMLTYVDYVEYDGPAYRAGMREGDVILSINGRDMEKADHKRLVECIKSCEARMRMVVLFEDCVRKVELHMRYIQLQNLLQSKMNELERLCLRERELLEGKWKTHSLPARKKAATSPADAETGHSVNDTEPSYYRPTLSTEDVANMARHQTHQSAIIPPPAQFMLTYHYLDPTYRYVLKPSTSNSSGEYFVSIGDTAALRGSPNEQHFLLTRATSGATSTASASTMHFSSQSQQRQPPMPPPRTCEKHKPPAKQQSPQHQPQHKVEAATPKKGHKSSKHCHGHSCNPCIGHFRWKSTEKAAPNVASTGDNVSLDAYDLASPCCDTHCVPTRRRNRHHKEYTHTHKHKHRERDCDSKERLPRPKPQTQASPNVGHHGHQHHHQGEGEQHQHQYVHQHHHHVYSQQQQHAKTPHQHHQKHQYCDSHSGSMRSRYFDLAAGLASHCSLHSCTSSDFAPVADSTSYTTSLSTDTLYWDPKSDTATSRQHSTKSRQSFQQPQQQATTEHDHQPQQPTHPQPTQQHVHSFYQQRYHVTATHVQPAQIYPSSAFHKPKSWDNLTTKEIAGATAYGHGYLETMSAIKPTAVRLQIAQQRHSIPRKNPYGRYSTYSDVVENYAPPPSQFVEELTTTTTTTITAKSTEELIAASPLQQPQQLCDCFSQQHQEQNQHALKSVQLQLSHGQKHTTHQTTEHREGYYLSRPSMAASNVNALPISTQSSNISGDVTTTSEVTRL